MRNSEINVVPNVSNENKKNDIKRSPVEIMYQKAVSYWDHDEQRKKDIEEFDGEENQCDGAIYSKEEIEKDKETVRKIKDKKAKDGSLAKKTRYSEILEFILYLQAEQSNWFGEDCVTFRTVDFDDWVNHVDMVAEFEIEGGQFIRLAIDVTTSQSEEGIDEKISRIEKSIENGNLATVKYFDSERANYTGKLIDTPIVIIGTSKEGVIELCGVTNSENGKKVLSKHYIQIKLLKQIGVQLKHFINHAIKNGYSEDHIIIQKQQKVLEVIEELEEKNKTRLEDGLSSQARDVEDNTHETIMSRVA